MNITKYDISDIVKKLQQKLNINMNQFTALIALKSMDPFKLLIATILSQNTNDKNSIKAYNNLENEVGITPSKLMNAEYNKIVNAIRIGGLYKQKAKAIKEISKYLVEKFDGDIMKIISLPPKQARQILLSLPKIGYKTADVILLFSRNYPFFPVDTHITRISKRLGIVSGDAKYEDIRIKWQELLDPKDYMVTHLLLIEFGRKICKARNPMCDKCPIKKYCLYYYKLGTN